MTITGSQGVDCASPPPCAYTLTVFCVFFFLSGSQLSAICPWTDSSTYLGAAAQLVNVDSRLGCNFSNVLWDLKRSWNHFIIIFTRRKKAKAKTATAPFFFFKHSTYILPKLMYFAELIQDQMWHVN